MVNQKEMEVKCDKCGYQWTTKSNLEFVVCPNCLRKLNKKKFLESREEEDGRC